MQKGLFVTEWCNLVFPHVSLKDLINVKRTCTTFRKCARLNCMIKEGEEKRFGKIEKRYWNRLVRLREGEMNIDDLIFDNVEKYMLLLMAEHGLDVMGLFVGDSKRSVINQFIYIAECMIYARCKEHNNFIEVDMKNSNGNHQLIYITGLKKEYLLLQCCMTSFVQCDRTLCLWCCDFEDCE